MADDALEPGISGDWPRSGRPRPLPGRHLQWALRWARQANRERRLKPVVRDGRLDIEAMLRSARADPKSRAMQLRRAFRASRAGDDDAVVTIAALVVAAECGDWPRVEGLVQFLDRSFERADLDAAALELRVAQQEAPTSQLLSQADTWDALHSASLAMAARARERATRVPMQAGGRPSKTPVVLRLSGGLGNQMFEYAAGLAYARRLGVPLRLDLDEYEHPRALRELFLGRLAVPVRRAGWLDILRAAPRAHAERQGVRDDVLRTGTRARWLFGNWEHPMYFDDVRNTLLRRFQPRDPGLTTRARAIVEAGRRAGGPVAGIHIRLGDRAPGRTFAAPLSTLPVSYYRKAVAQFPADTTFIVCSDSPGDATSIGASLGIEGRLSIAAGADPVLDLFTLAACDHVVLSAGTFSWWAAYLGDRPGRRVVAPDAIQAMSALRVVSPPAPPTMPGWTELPIRRWRVADDALQI